MESHTSDFDGRMDRYNPRGTRTFKKCIVHLFILIATFMIAIFIVGNVVDASSKTSTLNDRRSPVVAFSVRSNELKGLGMRQFESNSPRLAFDSKLSQDSKAIKAVCIAVVLGLMFYWRRSGKRVFGLRD